MLLLLMVACVSGVVLIFILGGLADLHDLWAQSNPKIKRDEGDLWKSKRR